MVDGLIRQKIITVIVEEMKNIRAKNGFYSEAGNNVFEWMDRPFEKDELPAIIIRDTEDSVEDNQLFNHQLKIEIDIAVGDGKNTIWNMREVSSDVLRAFQEAEKRLNYRCTYRGSHFLTEHKDTMYGGVRLEFEVHYQTRRWEQ